LFNIVKFLFADITNPYTMPFGITVAGGCNGSSTTNQTLLNAQADVMLGSNNTMYVADGSNQLLLFNLNNRTGRALRSFGSWPTFLFYDNRSSIIYITVLYVDLVYLWPTNQTIPPNGISSSVCSMYTIYYPTSVISDSLGNVYVASYECNWVTKWVPNATNGTLVVGSPSGTAGADSQSFSAPYGLALDEPNSALYVSDRLNHRVQKFILGSSVGVTVAGGNGYGPAANQLNNPTEIYLSKLDGSLYIADSFNNRVQKWHVNATSGITVAGSPNGIAGLSPYLMNLAYALAVDDQENYLYVSDCNNNRIQRFPLY
jgi:DNA-binding beta-propeller fold protein YncE